MSFKGVARVTVRVLLNIFLLVYEQAYSSDSASVDKSIEFEKQNPPMHSAEEKNHTFHIYMILFNGRGDCERGFTNYLRTRNINVQYIIRDCQNDLSKCPIEDYIAEIREKKPDLIYLWGTPLTQRIAGTIGEVDPKKHITDIPIIALPIANPVGAELTTGINNYTGRNLAGVSQMMAVEEQIRAIQIYAPFKKLGTIYTSYEKNISSFVEEWKKIAAERGDFEFIAKPIPLTKEGRLESTAIPILLKELADQNIDFLYMGPDTAILEFADVVIQAALCYKIPIFASSELTVQIIKPTLGFFSRFYHVGQLGGFKAEQILLRQKDNKELFTFESLKYMSYTLNVERAKMDNFYPPIKLLKFAQILE